MQCTRIRSWMNFFVWDISLLSSFIRCFYSFAFHNHWVLINFVLALVPITMLAWIAFTSTLNCCSVSNPLIIFHVLVYLHCLVSKSMAKITTRPIITVCSKKWAKKVAKQKISITHICYERWARFLFPSHFSLPHAHFHAHTHPQSHLNIRKQINANNELIHFVIIPSN